MAEPIPVNPNDINIAEPTDPVFVRSQPVEVIRVAILGALVGLVTAFVGWALAKFIIDPVFCGSPDSFGVCGNSTLTGYYVATVITGLIATVVLANWQIFRPLLVVVATIAVMWGFKNYASDLSQDSPAEYYAYNALLFALCYLLFYWLLRLHNFVVSLIFVVVAVVGIRLLMIS